uniref:DEK proto-oncogene n=1 Tax=Dicentrarchus labrax TaxID=13489 RepID=A0A8P4KR76_DICLA
MDSSAVSDEEVEERQETSQKDQSSPNKSLSKISAAGEIIEGKRAKKTVERLDFQAPKQKEKLKIGDGTGDKLGDIPRTGYQISKMKLADLKPLHIILFDRPGKMATLKKNLRLFNGFPFDADSEQYAKKREKLLKFVCGVLDLEKKGTHSDLVDRIMNFLIAPKNSGKTKKKSKPKPRSTSSSPKKSKTGSKSKAIVMDSSSDEDDDEEEEKAVASAEAEGSDTEDKPSEKEEEQSDKSEESAEEEEEEVRRMMMMKMMISDDDEPLIKMIKKAPTDEQLKETVQTLLKEANLEEMTMKQICQRVFDTYPDHDLNSKKDYIKQTVKSVSTHTQICTQWS